MAVLLFIQDIFKFFTSLPFIDFLLNFGLFFGTVSGYRYSFFLADTPQKLNNIYQAIGFAYSFSPSVQF